jgi:hypothetical protein
LPHRVTRAEAKPQVMNASKYLEDQARLAL